MKLSENGLGAILTNAEIQAFIETRRADIQAVLHGETGLADARGWIDVEEHSSTETLASITQIAQRIRTEADVFLVVGVGGSNRAAQALIEGLGRNSATAKPQILYMGNNLSAAALRDMVAQLRGKRVFANIIAKDFRTLEPGVAFRMLRAFLRQETGEQYRDRIVLTGTRGAGQLYEIAGRAGFSFLDFPQNVGGRFSAFTAVGLLPMAVAGVDIAQVLAGAKRGASAMRSASASENPAVRYAAIRHLLQQKGFCVESFALFEPRLEDLGRWWLQLHGETEGKCPAAVLPVLNSFSEDLHAIGQYIQEGGRFLFETLLCAFISDDTVIPPSDFEDGFACLDGKAYTELNRAVYDATLGAHTAEGIPVLEWVLPTVDETSLAEWMYINMVSSALSAVLLGVEPFDQNGVEAYKRNLHMALGRR